MGDATARPKLPVYTSHKRVEAAPIHEVHEASGRIVVDLPSGDRATLYVGTGWLDRHKPATGGFFVRYLHDGFESYSPRDPFLAGYTREAEASSLERTGAG